MPSDLTDDAIEAADARHQAANEPVAKAIRSQLVFAGINERQAAEARAQGRERMADHHAAIAAECRAAAEALRIESGITPAPTKQAR